MTITGLWMWLARISSMYTISKILLDCNLCSFSYNLKFWSSHEWTVLTVKFVLVLLACFLKWLPFACLLTQPFSFMYKVSIYHLHSSLTTAFLLPMLAYLVECSLESLLVYVLYTCSYVLNACSIRMLACAFNLLSLCWLACLLACSS